MFGWVNGLINGQVWLNFPEILFWTLIKLWSVSDKPYKFYNRPWILFLLTSDGLVQVSHTTILLLVSLVQGHGLCFIYFESIFFDLQGDLLTSAGYRLKFLLISRLSWAWVMLSALGFFFFLLKSVLVSICLWFPKAWAHLFIVTLLKFPFWKCRCLLK